MASNPEARLQIVIVNALRLGLPKDAVLWATLNERHVSKATGAYLNRMGRMAGMPDLMILYSGRLFCIELKLCNDPHRGVRKTYQSKEQKAAQWALQDAGAVYAVCRSLVEVEDLLGTYQVPMRVRSAA